MYFKPNVDEATRWLIVISVLTNYSQLSAELVGRRYGSGVLKNEPREAEKISLLLPKISKSVLRAEFEKIDKLVRQRKLIEAAARADELIYKGAGVSDWREKSIVLAGALETVRARRRPLRGAIPLSPIGSPG